MVFTQSTGSHRQIPLNVHRVVLANRFVNHPKAQDFISLRKEGVKIQYTTQRNLLVFPTLMQRKPKRSL